MAKERIDIIVARNDGGEITTIAVVSARRTEKVTDISSLRDAITRAVTRWMGETEDGRGAWDYSGDDFNIGDLGSYLDHDPLLGGCLFPEGVIDLHVTSPDFTTSWTWDTPLTDYEGDEDD